MKEKIDVKRELFCVVCCRLVLVVSKHLNRQKIEDMHRNRGSFRFTWEALLLEERDESLVTEGGERDNEAGEQVERGKSYALEGGVCF